MGAKYHEMGLKIAAFGPRSFPSLWLPRVPTAPGAETLVVFAAKLRKRRSKVP